ERSNRRPHRRVWLIEGAVSQCRAAADHRRADRGEWKPDQGREDFEDPPPDSGFQDAGHGDRRTEGTSKQGPRGQLALLRYSERCSFASICSTSCLAAPRWSFLGLSSFSSLPSGANTNSFCCLPF